ncbi:MAG: histidine kinase [Bacteroidetes bacterium]|nr:histidine kinase [Bacteroidota bacterium]
MNKKLSKAMLMLFITGSIYFIYTLIYPEHLDTFKINWQHIVFDIISLSLASWVIFNAHVWLNHKINNYTRWEVQPIRRLFIQVISSTLLTVLILIVFFPINFAITFFINPEMFSPAMANEADHFFGNLGYVILTLLLFFQAIFLGIYFYKNWVKSLIESEKLKKENIHSQLHALQNQANPHFLFNSLNTLTSLIEEDKETAIEFVGQLASFYRYLLQMQDDHLIQLGEELNFINAYIFLQSKRFGENLKIEMDIKTGSLKKYIPTFILQILLENAVKHNIISSENPLQIKIYSENDSFIIIENNIQKKHSDVVSNGYGIENIKNRYSILSRNNIEIFTDKNVFKVLVPLFEDQSIYEGINY